MENILILTPGSWKSIAKITPTTMVYRVHQDQHCTIETIKNWKSINGTPTYAAWNRVDQQTSFFAYGSEVLFQRLDDNQYYTSVGHQLYHDMNYSKIFLADRPTFETCNIRRSFNYTDINKMVRLGRLNTSLIDGTSAIAAQTLFAWKQVYGSYRTKDWNQALFLQALFVKTGTMSNIINNDGLNVVPSPRDRFDVTDLTYCKSLTINKQPVNKDQNVIHVIANYKGYTFIM